MLPLVLYAVPSPYWCTHGVHMVCTRVGPVVHSTMDSTTDTTRLGVGVVLRGPDTTSHGVIYGFHGIRSDREVPTLHLHHYIHTGTAVYR